MNAVFATGGKQYRVAPGDRLKVELLKAKVGETIEFPEVMLVADGSKTVVGSPYVVGGKISARVESHGRAKKIKVLKFKRRKGYMRTQGHRQYYTELEIINIEGGTA
ncbi:MAG: 50S ribosomal protein L21 [Gammaproteobacteria bacterium]|nr:50S ribosomal protein L21 [Gammaproteobacteria bacterium]